MIGSVSWEGERNEEEEGESEIECVEVDARICVRFSQKSWSGDHPVIGVRSRICKTSFKMVQSCIGCTVP